MSAETPNRARLVVQLGHSRAVTAVAYSPDGRLVLTGGWDRTARLWDAANGTLLRSFQGHTEYIYSVAFSPDGRFVLTGAGDGSARLWETATGKEVRRFEATFDNLFELTFSSVAFSPDGKTILTGLHDKTVRIWDVTTAKELRRFAGTEGDAVPSLTVQSEPAVFSPDGRLVLTGSGYDSRARLWDVASGRVIREFAGHTGVIRSVAFSPDGRTVLTGGDDRTARLWDVASGREVRRLQGHTESVGSVAFSPDGRTILTGSGDMTARLWEAKSGRALERLESHTGVVSSVAYSPDGRTVLTGSWQVAQMWDAKSGKEHQRFEGSIAPLSSAAFSRDGRFVLTGGGDILPGSTDRTARLWDLTTGKELRRFTGHSQSITSVAISPDERTVLTGSVDKTARLWDFATGKELRRFEGHTEMVSSVAFSPDGRSVLTGSRDRTARLWDAASSQQLKRFEVNHFYDPRNRWIGKADVSEPGFDGKVLSVAFSPDGRSVLLGATDKTYRTFDVASGKQLSVSGSPFNFAEITAVAYSPDGRFIVAGSADGTKVIDAKSGYQVKYLKTDGYAPVTSVAYSPDGRYVLTGSSDDRARLWDVTTVKQGHFLDGQLVHTFEGHMSDVVSVTFSPDSRFVLTGSLDGTARLWDVASGKLRASLVSFNDGGWAVVDPDGRFDTTNLDGGAPLHWIADDDPMRALPLEIFMLDYFTPRLLARIMNGEKLPPVRSIAEIRNRVQPEVEVVSVTASKRHAGRADVVVHAASRRDEKGTVSGLQDLRVFRNGQLVGSSPFRKPLGDGNFVFSDIQLPATGKSAVFTAYGFNSARIKSATDRRAFDYVPAGAAKPRAYLVQIGVDHYEASECELSFSSNDAAKLSSVLSERLKARGFEVVPMVLVSTTKQRGATKAEIRNALAAVAAKATPDDAFFLSFSGHGVGTGDGRYYILPSDIQGNCAEADEKMLRNAISADELAEWLRPIDAGEMTFVLDSCFSAKSVDAKDFKPGPMGSQGLGQLAYDKRIRILTASQTDQEAEELQSLKHGLLSYVLAEEGLVNGKADWKPKDQKIMAGEWLSYAVEIVPGFMGKGSSGRSLQLPALFDFNSVDSFVLQ